MDLQLRIPELADTLDPAIEIRRVYVEEQVEALPHTDPLRVFRGLFERLGEWNHALLKASLRLELPELRLPAYLRMVERHTHLRARASSVACERDRDEAGAARQVVQQFAYGYKIALLQSDEQRRLLGGNKQRRMATQRATLMLVYGLLHGYHQYLPGIRHQWPELHELYTFAEQSGLQQQSEVPRGVRPETSVSVETLYAQIAPLSAADRIHLAYGEVWTLFAALAQPLAAENLRLDAPDAAHAPHAADLLLSTCEGAPRRRAQWVNGGERGIDIENEDPEDTLPSAHLYITDSWQLANQSQTGICLTSERRSQNLPMVGELVGLRAPTGEHGDEKSSPWTAGIFRWLIADSRDAQRMGIELLSSNARPVHLAAAAAAHCVN